MESHGGGRLLQLALTAALKAGRCAAVKKR